MTVRFAGALAVAIALVGVAAARPAVAQVATDFASCAPDLAVCDANHQDCCIRDFDAIATDKAIVIPMDRCHQVLASGGPLAPPTAAGSWCSNPGPFSANDLGMFEAYGLVYRLMQHGIPVYWIVNPTKEPPALTSQQNLGAQSYANRDVDAWIISGGATPPSSTSTALATCSGTCTAPVKLLKPATLAPSTAWTYGKKQFPLRGGAFVIAPEDRPRFNELFLRTGEFASLAGNANYDFASVDLYEVQNGATFAYQDFRSGAPYTLGNGGHGAPVAVRIDYAPPRLARLAPAGVSNTWLSLAKLNVPADYPACKANAFAPADAVFCDVTKGDIGAGALVAGKFNWAWIDNWSPGANPCTTAAEREQIDQVRAFMTHVPSVRGGGHVVFMEAVIDLLERCQDRQLQGVPSAGVGLATSTGTPSEPLILRRAANLYMQWGDLPTEFASGAVGGWWFFGHGAAGYAPAHLDPSTGTLVRLVSEDRAATGNALCSRHRSSPACDVYAASVNADTFDVASYLRFNDDPANGVAFYMGGNQINNNLSQLRMVLNALITMPLASQNQLPDDTQREVSRSSPVVIGATAYHGSFTLKDPAPVIPVYEGTASDATFRFPYTHGHYWATDLTANATVFDAAEHIPAVTVAGCASWFSAACRTIFTNTAGGAAIPRTYVSTQNASALGPLLGATLTAGEVTTLISRVLAGDQHADGSWHPALGGIDRSSAAIVEPSPLIPLARPTMAYVGGLDGMLHAICIDTIGPCVTRGQELWGFIPRVLLPRLRLNDGRLDGSPKVADVFADYDADGRREWKTVLTFQVGSGQPGITGFTPAVYALDITNPADPKILWEVATPAVRGASELGVGTSLAMAPTRTSSGGTRNLTFVVTSNGGTGGAGLHVVALVTETGAVAWTWSQPYGASRLLANPLVPASGVPGGPVAIDRDESGTATWLAVPSLYGDVWLLDAGTGVNRHGAQPLFRFSTDFHPIGASPTLYRDGGGALRLVLGSGGYTDPVSTAWAPVDQRQYLVSIAVNASSVPVTEAGAPPDVAFAVPLGDGERIYAQAVVEGGELYAVTDSADVNDSGYGLDGDTGTLVRIGLATGGVRATETIRSGAGSVDGNGGKVYSVADSHISTTDFTSDFDAVGEAVEFSMTSSSGAKLWLRID